MPRGKRGKTTDALTEDTTCKILALVGACTVVTLILYIIYFGGFILILFFVVPFTLLALIFLPFVYKDKAVLKEFYFYLFFILMAIGWADLVGLLFVALISLIILLA